MSDRIDRLRAKVEEMGLGFHNYGTEFIICLASGLWSFKGNASNKHDLTTVESLLAALAPGPVVRIETAPDCAYCYYKCALLTGCPWNIKNSKGAFQAIHCPGSAPDGYEWRMCLLPKGETDE